MIVIALVAIIASFAVPSYLSHTKKAYRSEAQSALVQLASALTRHHTLNNTYTGTHDASGIPVTTFFPATAPIGDDPLYNLKIATTSIGSYSDGEVYEIFATPIANTIVADDHAFKLSFTGQKFHSKDGGKNYLNGW